MTLEIENNIRKEIGPLRVQIHCELRNHVYYIVLDGTRTYPVSQYWMEKWGKNFQEFALLTIKRHTGKALTDKDVTVISPTRVEVRLGSVLDFVKDTE
jgi:hypothetical protein